MALVLLVLVAALAIRLVAGRGAVPGNELLTRGPLLLVVAVLAQAGGALLGPAGYRVGLVLSAALAVAFLARNRQLAGVPLVAAGLLLNAAVVLANGAMPVSRWAAARAGVDAAAAVPVGDTRHRVADHDTRLAVLGDVVPLALPPRREVVSPGDCLLAAGLGLLVVRGRRRERLGPVGRRRVRGEEVTQAQGTQAQQGQPRQAPQRLRQ